MTKPPRRRARAAAPRAQRGIALIIVLWITIMLTVIAGGFAFAMRSEAMSARNALSLAQARAAANGAVERMAFELVAPALPGGVAGRRAAAPRGATATCRSSRPRSTSRRRSTSTPRPIRCCKGLIEKVGGADPEATARIVDAIQDWRDPDDVRRPNGAEDADYQMAGLQQKPANMPFETVSELARVLGMTPGDLRARRRQRHRELAPARHQPDDGVARRAARAAQRDARGRRRVSRSSARRRWRRSCRSRRFRRVRLRRGRGARLAHPRRGARARWCNLRPRSGRPTVGRRAPAAAHVTWQDGVTVARPPRSRPQRPPDHKTADSPMADRELTLPRFSARMHDAARRLGVSGFWQWWARGSSIRSCRPRRARRSSAAACARSSSFEGDHATLWRPSVEGGRAAMAPAATIALDGDAAGVAAAGRAALAPPRAWSTAGPPAPGASSWACRRATCCARTSCCRPPSRRTCSQALAYDLDRHTPFKPEELYFDAVVVERNAARGTITVDLAAVRARCVDPALKHVAAWGCEVAAVVPEPPAAAATSRLNLLPPRAAHAQSVWTRWQFWLPLALLVVLALAAVAIPLWQKREYAMELRTLADQARARAADLRDAAHRARHARGRLQHRARAQVRVPRRARGRRHGQQAAARRHLAHAVRAEEPSRRARRRSATCWCAAKPPTPAGSCSCSRSRSSSRRPRSAAPTTKIQPGPGEIFDLGAQLKPRDAAGAHRAGGFREACRRRCATPDAAPAAGTPGATANASPPPLPGASPAPAASAAPAAPPRLPRLSRRTARLAAAPSPAATPSAPGASPAPAAMPAPTSGAAPGAPAATAAPAQPAPPAMAVPAPTAAAATPPATLRARGADATTPPTVAPPPADAGTGAGGSGKKT